ncbi:LOW QUALITY PROTEIN: lipoxygenase homology domain-containing protein 1-like [Babylonia areolata]|uniref:LOW QUALITY PROTEIN: lipoxygenase homology domain-containing protein 1-like n=1 Tax=Babylonia areolata TaxID=304850 RepID=UPI003FD34631
MSITGGSFMQQPNTNSEGVRRCLTIAEAPRSSQMKYAPRPPYAAGPPKKMARPSSAPVSRQLGMEGKPAWHNSNYKEPRHFGQVYAPPARGYKPLDSNLRLPYAERKMEAFVNSTLGYPRVENGKSVPIPSYDPMLDPHLVDYFESRFGQMQLEELKRQRMLRRFARPRSAGGLTLGSRRGLRSSGKGKDGGEVLYKVAVTTGDVKNAGTDAKVFLKIKGTRGKLPKTRLTKKAGSVKSNKGVAFRFARGSTHVFKIRGLNIGDIQSLVIETSAVRKEEAWFLQEIEVVNTKTKKTWLFTCNQWFSLYHGDGQVLREFFPVKSAKTEYEIVTVTGDVLGGGTNANVFLTLFGKTGTTRKLHLTNNAKTMFKRGNSDVFRVKTNCVGPMKKVRIEHDNTGVGAGWYLERVVVTDLHNSQWKYFFPCGQWLSKSEGDGAICRDLIGSRDPLATRKASKYKVSVFTGNKKGAGTDANVYITMFGEFGDSGEKKLTSRKNNFERGKTDEFILESPKLGRLERIRIGHDNSGFGPGWFLDKVIVDDVDMGTVFEFPCSRWFAMDEDDGQISRELVLNVGPMDASPGIPYIITVSTGDEQNAGTDARVFMILHGGEKGGGETSGTIWLESGKFKRGMTDIFNVDVLKVLSPLSHIDVGHDNTGVASGWLLESVTVYCPLVGIEQVFPCGKWLATSEAEGVVQRTLYEQTGLRRKREKKIPWQVWVFTSDIKNAGTDAQVSMVVYGEKGKSDDIPLDNKGDNFEQGHMDMFKVDTVDVGVPYKIRVWHDNAGTFAGWHLNKIEMQSLGSKTRFSFPCERWLAEDEDDKEIVRELPATGPAIKKPLPVVHYKVEVHTGKKSSAGTDANVYINIFGDLGDTGKRYLRHSKTNRNKFEKGQVDEFEIEAVTLMKLRKIRIGHDGRGSGAGWFLDKVVVRQMDTDKYDAEFVCNRWLAEDEDDGQIERELLAGGAQMLNTTTYHVYVKTGDVRNAGTDANVFLKMFGGKGDTDSLKLRSAETSSNKFERGRTDLFKLDTTDIGKIKKIKIGHDGTKPGSGWFLDEVRIDIPSQGQNYLFACHRWLAEDEGDRLTEIEIEPSSQEKREKTIPYEVTVWTGDLKGAGTDANVFLQMYGEEGKTEEVKLRNKTDNFERAAVDKFKVEAASIGQLQKIRIGHDDAGRFAGWHLEKLLIQRQALETNKRKQKKKLSETERRKSLLNIHRHSEDEESDSSPSTSPRRGRRKSHYMSSGSRLDAVMEEDEGAEDTEDYWFFVNQWFARSEGDGEIVREFIPTDEKGRPLKGRLEEVEYTVHVKTGDEFGAGTDSSVFVTLYGEKGDTGERQLKESNNRNKFERKQEDVFSIKAVDLGKLVKVKIRHDNGGMGSAWFLDSLEVQDGKRKKSYFFPCQRWLATNKDDGQICRELVPVDAALKRKMSHLESSTAIRDEIGLETKAAMTTYHVKVTTGDVWGAGTDANIFIILYGDIDNTGKMFLKSSLNNKNKFERNQMDEFILETVKIGELKKIRIGHDNAGGGAAWHLNNVEIDCPSLGATWMFPCNRWLSEKDDDGLIERELFPQELETTQYKPCIPYEITTYTSDKSGASTDADVYVVLYGKDDVTQQKSLCHNKRERKDRFKKGSSDKFVVELEDVGETIEKVRIGHDGSGFGAGWHLDRVEVRRLHDTGKGSLTYVFPCGRWLARNEEDGAIERELLPKKVTKETLGRDGQIKTQDVKIRDKLIAKQYTVEVFTGDVSGAGTDANVFIIIFGDKGDSGERKLHQSETNKDKFERGKMDRFVLEAVDLGSLYKVKIRHDNSLFSPAWYLDRVEVTDNVDKQKYLFHCERWLGKNKEDGKIERSLYVKGYDGDMSSTGTLRSTKYGSVSSLDSMRDPFSKTPRMTRKQLQQSLEDVAEGPLMPYTVRVTTGAEEDQGTSSNVWVKVYGPQKKHTGRLFLELAQKDHFAPGSVEIFSLEAADVDEIKKIEIGHDGTAPGTGWFLKEMDVDLPTKGKHYHFDCRQWLARDRSDGKTTRIFSVDDGTSSVTSYRPLVPYEVTVTTGDVSDAGTDAKIFITVFGTKGSSSPIELEKNDDRFERARTDVIKMELDDVAPLKKLRVSLETKGCTRKSWYLEKIELRNMDTGTLSVFKHDNWLGKGKEGAQKTVDIPAMERGKKVIDRTDYKISVKTSDVRGAGTDANVYVILFGLNGDSGELHLKDSETGKSPFQNGQLDVFTIKGILSLGELSKLRIWHDNKGFGASWHLSSVEVEDLTSHRVSVFHCDRWLSKSEDDKQILRELTCASAAKPTTAGGKEKVVYEIEVTTADKKNGGTIHNGWLILEGSKSTSKAFLLTNSAQNKILRRGQTDNFSLTSSALGKLESCIVGAFEREDRPIQDPVDREDSWFCHEVVVTDTSTGNRYTFPCKAWVPIMPKISKKDGKVCEAKQVQESLMAKAKNLAPVKYEVVVHTGDMKGAGTNANVTIIIYGVNGDTGPRPLKQRFRDLFERNQVDKFQLEALDLGELTKVHIEHDNSGFRPGWFLDHVEIVNMGTSATTVFPCGKWFDRDKGDNEIARDLFPKSD